MAESGEVTLLVDDKVFKATKDMLCEHSDYFRAMFSGNYIENDKNEISINVVQARAMEIILRYMKLGLIDLSEYPLCLIGELAVSANFLQITELTKQVDYCLGLQLSLDNWVSVMSVAENASFSKLEEQAAALALYSFKQIQPQSIQSVYKLGWYLSHPYLSTDSELEVFKFGLKWVKIKETGADTLLYILGCLDMKKTTKEDLNEMKDLVKEYENSLAEKVVDCLYKLATDDSMTAEEIMKNKTTLCELYTERVYSEVLDLVCNSTKRLLVYKPFVPLYITSEDPYQGIPVNPHYMYSFEGDGFKKWLEVADRELWGWNVVSWGPTKLIIVSGEHGRGTGFFWKDLKVYDLLTKEWTQHGVQLPIRRHGGVAVLGDSLYIIGGVGGFRVVLDTALIYDLKQRSYREIARLPDAIQSPAICVHESMVYASGHKNIYRYEDHGKRDVWARVIETDIRPSCFVSYRGYIYCSQNYFTNFYRFRPDVDKKLELITCFSHPPATMVNLGNRLLAFTNANGTQAEMVTVEEYKEGDEKPVVLWSKKTTQFSVNDVAGSCALIDTVPPIKPDISPYLKRHLAKYEACYSNE